MLLLKLTSAHLPLLPPPPPSTHQDEALRLGPARRGGEAASAEKKVAVLEKALSLHPGCDELLLELLRAVWQGLLPCCMAFRRWSAESAPYLILDSRTMNAFAAAAPRPACRRRSPCATTGRWRGGGALCWRATAAAPASGPRTFATVARGLQGLMPPRWQRAMMRRWRRCTGSTAGAWQQVGLTCRKRPELRLLCCASLPCSRPGWVYLPAFLAHRMHEKIKMLAAARSRRSAARSAGSAGV